MRDDRREREKYGRASIAEQLGGELAVLRRNTPLLALIAALIGGWLILTLSEPPPVRVGEARAGDCLYIHALDADTDNAGGRPIGSDGAVISALFRGGAERAGCDASHSHEVADAWVLDDPLVAAYPGQGELTRREQARCEAAFEAYVGRASDGSSLALTIAALVVFFTAFNLLEAVLPSLVSKFAPPEIKGTAVGVYSSVQFLGTFVGAAGGGLLSQWHGAAAVFGFCLVLTALWLGVTASMAAAPVSNEGTYSMGET